MKEQRKDYTWGGVPYGYRLENGKVKVDEYQADIIKKVFDLYNNHGYGASKIARILNDMKVPQPKTGKSNWTCFPIGLILKRTEYIGKLTWNGNVYDSEFPPIVEEEIFNFTQMQIEKNSTTWHQRKKHYDEYLLVGLLKCGECGSAMRVKVNNPHTPKEKWCYLCRDASIYRGGCKATHLHRIEELDNIVSNYIFNGFLQEYDFTKHEINIDNSDILVKRLDKVNRDLEKALQGFYNEVFTMDEYKAEKEKLNDLKQEIEAEISRSKTAKGSLTKNKTEIKIMTAKEKFYSTDSILEKKNELIKLFKYIEIWEDGRIECTLR